MGFWALVGLLILGAVTVQARGQGVPSYPAAQVQQQVPPQQGGVQPVAPGQYAPQPQYGGGPVPLPSPAAGPQPQGPASQPSPTQLLEPPFVLQPNEQGQVNRVLKAWEQASAQVKTFECTFRRWQYNNVFDNGSKPLVHDGVMKYAAPDKGLFRVDGDRPEQWICDGQSVFEFNYQRKELIEHRLPPELQGKSIVDGPLPFMFGAQAEKLSQRYYLRIVQQNDPGQIMLEAFPRLQRDAANFSRVFVMLDVKTLQPTAVKIFEPSGQSQTVYAFQNPLVNFKDPLIFLKGDPFFAKPPGLDWRRVVDQPATARQAKRQ